MLKTAIRVTLAGMLATLGAAPALAFSTTYEMVSVGSQRETQQLVPATAGQRLFAENISASFSFTYADTGFIGTAFGGYKFYSWFALDGQIAGIPFTRSDGIVTVGDDNLCASSITPDTLVDCLVFSVNPISNNYTPADAIAGIQLTNADGETFVLTNIVFGWVEDWNGTGDFLQSSTLPPTLPPPGTELAAIQFAFSNFNVPEGASPVRHSVLFDTAAIVPLPAAGWLLVPALGFVVSRFSRRARG